MDKLMKRTFNAQVSEQVLKTVHDRELHTIKDPKIINEEDFSVTARVVLKVS